MATSWTAKARRRRTGPAKRPLSWSAPTARERNNTERVSELEARIAAAGAELEQTRTQMAGIEEERTQQRSFLETAAGEAHEFRQKVEARQHEARAAAEEVYSAERES